MIFGPLFGFGGFGRFLFGWAKPVPIMSRNFRNFKRDDTLVSLAGPASNLLLAIIAFLGLAILVHAERGMPATDTPSATLQALEMLLPLAFQLNLTLCIFNLIPIPPLDGSHMLRHVLPYNAVQLFDRISGIASYILIIFLGRAILGIVMTPIMRLAQSALAHV
jgi:Zn-dependent protease